MLQRHFDAVFLESNNVIKFPNVLKKYYLRDIKNIINQLKRYETNN